MGGVGGTADPDPSKILVHYFRNPKTADCVLILWRGALAAIRPSKRHAPSLSEIR